MEQQKGSFKNESNQGQNNDRKRAESSNSLQDKKGITTHADPKSRDDNRTSKGTGADERPLEN